MTDSTQISRRVRQRPVRIVNNSPVIYATDDTIQTFDRLSAEEIAYIWRTHPNWRLPHGCRERNKRHAEAVDLVVEIANREFAGRGQL